MSRCTRKESYVIVSSLAKMWKLRRRRKRSLKGKRLLNLRKKEVKLRVKGYNKARYVPSANMSSRAGQMQWGQGSLSICTSRPRLRKKFWSKFPLLLLTALEISIFRSGPQRAKHIFAKLQDFGFVTVHSISNYKFVSDRLCSTLQLFKMRYETVRLCVPWDLYICLFFF